MAKWIFQCSGITNTTVNVYIPSPAASTAMPSCAPVSQIYVAWCVLVFNFSSISASRWATISLVVTVSSFNSPTSTRPGSRNAIPLNYSASAVIDSSSTPSDMSASFMFSITISGALKADVVILNLPLSQSLQLHLFYQRLAPAYSPTFLLAVPLRCLCKRCNYSSIYTRF